jgi:hypothetical protein
MPSTFLGITTGSKLYITNQLKINLVLWLDEAFLNAGMYRNITTSGEMDYAGNILSQLTATNDARYPSGTYWEAHTNNWVHESGLSIQSGFTTPFRPSGVYLRVPGGDYTFYPNGSSNGNYNFVTDFKEGAVKFLTDYIVSPDSTLLCPHSYKEVHVDIADSDRFVQFVDSDTKNESIGSGIGYPTAYQVQYPAVFVDYIDDRWVPFELGGNKVATCSVYFHVFADNPVDRDQICDMIGGMQGKNLRLADFNTAPFPLNDNNDINTNYPNLDTLQSIYPYKTCYFRSVESTRYRATNNIYRGRIQSLLEIHTFN